MVNIYLFVNIGFESADAATLRHLKKPLEISKIEDAFQMMLDVNRSYYNMEIGASEIDRRPISGFSGVGCRVSGIEADETSYETTFDECGSRNVASGP